MKSKELKEQIVIYSVCSLGLYFLAFLAFTKEQKDWFKERDNNECQFPVVIKDGSYKPCGRKTSLQLHHGIVPQRWGKEKGYDQEDLDVPENGIYLCESHHQGIVHNDMLIAKLAYGKNKEAYAQAFKDREKAILDGKKYWNSSWDYWFYRIIMARNKMFAKPYPYRRKQQERIANGGLKPIEKPVEK